MGEARRGSGAVLAARARLEAACGAKQWAGLGSAQPAAQNTGKGLRLEPAAPIRPSPLRGSQTRRHPAQPAAQARRPRPHAPRLAAPLGLVATLTVQIRRVALTRRRGERI